MHGPRVIGAEAFAAQQKNVKVGADRFGPRVRGVNTQTQTAPPPGARTTTGSRVNSPEPDAVAVEELRRILAENGTFFDGLYETELSRAEGARPDALLVFLVAEKAGQQRKDVLDEINELLADKGVQLTSEATQFTDGPESDLDAPIGDGKVPPPPPPPVDEELEEMSKAELEAKFTSLGGDLSTIVSTGAKGRPIRVDILNAVKALQGKA